MRVVVVGRRGRLGVLDVEDLHRPADVLQRLLAAVDEGIFDPQLDQVAHGARHGDAAGLGQRLDAGGEVDAVAEDVLVLLVDDHLAEMDADAEVHALLGLDRVVEARHALLDIERGADGGHRRAELGQHGVARGADQAAVAAWMAGRQTSICAVFRCRKVRVSEPSIMRVKPAMSAWTMAARRRCMIDQRPLKSGVPPLTQRGQAFAEVFGGGALAHVLTD